MDTTLMPEGRIPIDDANVGKLVLYNNVHTTESLLRPHQTWSRVCQQVKHRCGIHFTQVSPRFPKATSLSFSHNTRLIHNVDIRSQRSPSIPNSNFTLDLKIWGGNSLGCFASGNVSLLEGRPGRKLQGKKTRKITTTKHVWKIPLCQCNWFLPVPNPMWFLVRRHGSFRSLLPYQTGLALTFWLVFDRAGWQKKRVGEPD